MKSFVVGERVRSYDGREGIVGCVPRASLFVDVVFLSPNHEISVESCPKWEIKHAMFNSTSASDESSTT
jgi:hypothetical protein